MTFFGLGYCFFSVLSLTLSNNDETFRVPVDIYMTENLRGWACKVFSMSAFNGQKYHLMRHVPADREERIVSLFRQGNALAMEMLYADYASYLTGVCARYIRNDDDLKDVLQEGFIKIFTQIDRFEYRGKGSLRAWASRIMVNESLQALRRQKQLTCPLPEDMIPDLPDEEPDTDGLEADTLVRLIRKLPDGYRAVLNLYVLEGKSHKEIARLLGIKPDSSASQLHRAKNMLAQLIKNHQGGKL